MKTKLPSLKELRHQADVLGIDHKPFGKKRRALSDAIDKYLECGEKRSFHFRTSSSIGPIEIVGY